MLTFGAESPREQIDYAAIDLSVDALQFVVLRVRIAGREVDLTLRMGLPTAKELGQAMWDMAKSQEDGL